MKSVGASINMKQDIEKVLISEDEIQQKVKQRRTINKRVQRHVSVGNRCVKGSASFYG